MADDAERAGAQRDGPLLAADITEIQAIFATDAALQDAVGRLRAAGFDHADLSLPIARPEASRATPDQGAAAPLGDDDARATRTMGTSMAGTVGAFAAAAATVATGGAVAVAAAAAAAAGAGAAALAHGAHDAANASQREEREAAAARGELVLSVRTPDAQHQARAEEVLHQAGALRIAAVTRTDATVPAGVDSSAWTGG